MKNSSITSIAFDNKETHFQKKKLSRDKNSR